MSDSLKDLLLCMLQKDPVERITLPLMKVKFNPFQRGDRHYTSESDFYRRQILMFKDDPHAGRIKNW